MDTLRIGVQVDASQAKAGAKQAEAALAGVGDAARQAGRDLGKTGAASKTADREIDKVGDAAAEASKDLDRLATEGQQAERAIDEVSRAATAGAVALGRMDRSLSAGTAAVRSRMAALRTTGRLTHYAASGIVNQYTAIGAGIGATATAMSSARLDTSLNRVAMTAKATAGQTESLRAELYEMSRETGTSIDDLVAGFGNLIQQGASWDEARAQIRATNIAMAVTGAGAQDLTNALGVASAAFDFDMAKPGLALEILDKMRVAGDLASAEMNMLPDIFARVGVNASRAGMGIDQSLAFIEVLSSIEKNPERLATLADSTLRLFTNFGYLKKASKASGVRFFNPDGNRRDVAAILGDLRQKFRAINDEGKRAEWIDKVFGDTDIDTQKGLGILLGGDALANLGEFTTKISQAAGTLQNQQGQALNTAETQVARLTATLRKAGESFARPINEVVKVLAQWGADNPGATKGALVAGGGIVAAAGTVVVAAKLIEAARTVGSILGRGKGGSGGVAGALGGIAAGGDGVRVFVTNWGGIGASVPGGPISSGPIAAENAAAQTAARTGILQRLFPTFSRWAGSMAGWAKGASAAVGSKAQQLGVWAVGQRYGMERMLGRTAAGRWAMGAGSSMLQRSSSLWRNAAWGSGAIGTLSRFGTPLLRGSIGAAALGIPLEWLTNGVNLRSTVAGAGGAIGGVTGWMGGAALGAATTAGVGSIPLAIGGSMAGSWAGREGALALFDWLAGMRDVAPGAQGNKDFSPEFNIDVRFDEFGRPTTSVTGPGVNGMRVNTPRIGPGWAPQPLGAF